jgi:hypothetical protein
VKLLYFVCGPSLTMAFKTVFHGRALFVLESC